MFLYKQVLLPPLETAVLNFQDDRRTDEHMVRCDLGPIAPRRKSKRPHPGTKILSQIPVGGEGNRGQMPHICPGSPLPRA